MRQLNSLDQFKVSVRQWVCNTCPCRLCKVYLQNVGFLSIFYEEPNLAKNFELSADLQNL